MVFDANCGSSAAEVNSERQLVNYLQHINSPDFNAEDSPLNHTIYYGPLKLACQRQFITLKFNK